ncbi:hypothetical protein ACFL2D_00780 [Patescibacteria group bacterium]
MKKLWLVLLIVLMTSIACLDNGDGRAKAEAPEEIKVWRGLCQIPRSCSTIRSSSYTIDRAQLSVSVYLSVLCGVRVYSTEVSGIYDELSFEKGDVPKLVCDTVPWRAR